MEHAANEPITRTLRRRAFLRSSLAATLALAAHGAGQFGEHAQTRTGRSAHAQEVPLTPACADAEDTVSNAEGPYYRLYTPARQSFRSDVDGGVLLSLRGTVTDAHCQLIPGVVLDFWHANGNGEYDLSGSKCRGHQYTRGDGTYLLETVVPKWYIDGELWRTSHIHAAARGSGGGAAAYGGPENSRREKEARPCGSWSSVTSRAEDHRLQGRGGP